MTSIIKTTFIEKCIRLAVSIELYLPFINSIKIELEATKVSYWNQPLTFLTWNIYQGADLAPVITNPTPENVTAVFRQFLATNFPLRAKAIAREIALKKPDIIGLQEAVIWEQLIPQFGVITYDFIDILLFELKKKGLCYEAAAVNQNTTASALDSNGNTIRFTDRDAILIRQDVHPLTVVNTESANYTANIVIGPFVILRGFSFVDIQYNHQVFRVITTHLETFNEAIRNAQITELLNGPANTNCPIILLGDFNMLPGSAAYNLVINSGFQDTWNEIGLGPGFTSQQNADLLNNESQLSERIDYIFFRGNWEPLIIRLVGDLQSDRTKTGLWPSDHAGIAARFILEDPFYNE